MSSSGLSFPILVGTLLRQLTETCLLKPLHQPAAGQHWQEHTTQWSKVGDETLLWPSAAVQVVWLRFCHVSEFELLT
jgi:hypothetical protein